MRHNTFWNIYIPMLLALSCLFAAPLSAQDQDNEVEIMIIGSPHLRQHDFDRIPIALTMIRNSLAEYEPDLIAVEWLHPSLPRQDIDSYSPLPDAAPLSKLWGIKTTDLKEQIESTRALIASASKHGIPAASLRILLGKLLYLGGDQLNAGYQWYLAGEQGAAISDVRNLTQNNFAGHELRVFGFKIAAARGHEYLCPFDYQGEDAAWLGNDIQNAVMRAAISQVHGADPDDPAFAGHAKAFRESLQAMQQSGDQRFMQTYGEVAAVQQYMAYMQFFMQAAGRLFSMDDPTGLEFMRFFQTDEFSQGNRSMYYDYLGKITAEDIGPRTVANYERRNRRMADLLEADIERLNAKKVMVIVGGGHKSFLEDILAQRGYTIVPSIDFMP